MTVVVPTWKIVTTIQRKSGIEADAVQNVWYYGSPSGIPTSTDYGNWMNTYTGFLDAQPNIWSSVLDNGPGKVTAEFTKLPAEKTPALGPPTQFLASSWAGSTSDGYPSEVSVVVSLDGTSVTDAEVGPGGTRPAQRKRNRKFLGPLAEANGVSEPITKEVRPSTPFLTQLLQDYITHMITNMLTIDWTPYIFSPTNWQVYPVKLLWADNAFDTQRRRGEEATLKNEELAPGTTEAFIEQHAKVGVRLVDNGFGQLVRLPN
jgi:hypothetical protein